MGGGHEYEGLPHPHPTVPYWQSPPQDIAFHRSTKELPEHAEYVVVGSGITGGSVATKLLDQQPSAKIVILEARTAGSGATGRNGGHCRAGFWAHFERDLERHGTEEALKLETLEHDNIANLAAFVRANNIDCDLESVETVDVFKEQGIFDEALETLKTRDRICAGTLDTIIASHRVLYGKEASDYLEIPDIAGAVAFPAYTLSGYKLACGILNLLLKRGVSLQTTTPVLSVDKDEDDEAYPWSVTTERGLVKTKKVILATNAYTNALLEPLAKSGYLIPTRAQVVAVRPGDKISGNPVLKRSAGLNGRGLGDYMLSRAKGLSGEGDIIYGGGRLLSESGEQPILDDSTINPKISDYLLDAAPGFFGRDSWGKNGRTLMEWTGIMGYTRDKQPMVGEVPGIQDFGCALDSMDMEWL